MITAATIGATFVQAAHLLTSHLTDHALPEPACLEVISRAHHSRHTCDRVHLSMASTLCGPAGTIELTIFGGADHDPALVGDPAPGEYRAVALGELRTWAAASHPLPMARG